MEFLINVFIHGRAIEYSTRAVHSDFNAALADLLELREVGFDARIETRDGLVLLDNAT